MTDRRYTVPKYDLFKKPRLATRINQTTMKLEYDPEPCLYGFVSDALEKTNALTESSLLLVAREKLEAGKMVTRKSIEKAVPKLVIYAMMSTNTSLYHAIAQTLPTELAVQLEQHFQQPSTDLLLDALLCFVCGADCPEMLSDNIRAEWSEKQQAVKKLLPALSLELKRPRDEDEHPASLPKRQRLTPSSSNDEQHSSANVGQPLFTLHSISVTSPIRKKVDITACEHALRFTSPGAQSVEATVPLSSLRRAFLLPTRGKNKAHWTVVIISSDSPHHGKSNSASAQAHPQVIFGIDAAASPSFTATTHGANQEAKIETIPKGGATLPSLRRFLSRLDIPLLEPTVNIFKSACSGYGTSAGQGGIPGVEAYRAAKVGSLWFMKEGILWGESKPCEFWAVEDLLGKSEGLRLLRHPGGRTCSVTLTRRSSEVLDDDEEDMGTETEFTMIDAREQEGINQWVRAHRHLFGNIGGSAKDDKADKELEKHIYTGPITIHQIGDEDDEEDEDFAMDSSNEDVTSSSSSSESDGEGGDEDQRSEAEEDSSDAALEEEGIREENHPLLQPGAVPRMSKAAVDMVVGMVKSDLLGDSDEDEDQNDELNE